MFQVIRMFNWKQMDQARLLNVVKILQNLREAVDQAAPYHDRQNKKWPREVAMTSGLWLNTMAHLN